MSDLTIREIKGIYNKKMKNLTKQEIQRYKTWANDEFVYILEELALKIIKVYKGLKEKTFNFRSKLGFKEYDIIMTKEKLVATEIIKSFSNEEVSPQHNVLGKKLICIFHLYFFKEVDEKGHIDRMKKR